MNMNRCLRYATCLLLTTLSACATHRPAPDWVNGDSKNYPAAQYLSGHGQADTREAAQDQARADISKTFKVTVRASTDNVQTATRDVSGGNRFEQQASLRVSSRTDQVISGIQIVEIWQDSDTASYHALAVLPRAQAAATFRQQMAELDDATRGHVERARSENDPFLKIAALGRALKAQQERDALQKNLQVVDGSGRGMEAAWNSAALRTELEDTLKRVSIAARVPGNAPEGTRELVSGALAQAGFIADSSGHPEFVLQADLKLTDLGQRDSWYWMRGNLEIVLIESAGNKVRGTHTWSLKGNASNKADAARRTMNQAGNVLSEELGATIIEMATAK
jgi:hypothetical protein